MSFKWSKVTTDTMVEVFLLYLHVFELVFGTNANTTLLALHLIGGSGWGLVSTVMNHQFQIRLF